MIAQGSHISRTNGPPGLCHLLRKANTHGVPRLSLPGFWSYGLRFLPLLLSFPSCRLPSPTGDPRRGTHRIWSKAPIHYSGS